MRNKILFLALFLLVIVTTIECKRSGRGRGSGSSQSSSRRSNNNPQPAPTSLTNPQPAPKPTLFGWQEKPAQRSQATGSRQSKPSQTHSYPSSQTGMSGNSAPKQPPSYQETVQKSHSYPQNNAPSNQQPPARSPSNQQPNGNQPSHTYPANNQQLNPNQANHAYPPSNQQPNLNQQSHGYPSSHGLSGNAGSGAGYPVQQGGAPHGAYPSNNNYYGHHQAPPPPYPGNYGPGFGGHGYNPGYGGGMSPQMPGYFGNYGNGGRGFGGMSRSGSALTGVGIAGAGIGTVLTGLALWNLARSTGRQHHTVIYDNRGQPVAVAPANNETSSAMESMLADLANCSLTISSVNATEVLAIPCAIATSFSSETDAKDVGSNSDNAQDSTKCIVAVLTKTGKEFTTTIPCSILLSTAAENNVTEAPLIDNATYAQNITDDIIMAPMQTTDLPQVMELKFENATSECKHEIGENRDPINPCFAVQHNLTVLPLEHNHNDSILTTPVSA